MLGDHYGCMKVHTKRVSILVLNGNLFQCDGENFKWAKFGVNTFKAGCSQKPNIETFSALLPFLMFKHTQLSVIAVQSKQIRSN